MDLFGAESNNNNSTGVPFYRGFFMLVGFAILGLVVGSLIGVLIIFGATDGKVSEISTIVTDPRYAGTMRLVQAMTVLVSMFLPTFLVSRMLSRKPFQLMGFSSEFSLARAGLVVAILLVSAFLVGGAFSVLNKELADAVGWSGWAEKLEKDYGEQVGIMLDMRGLGGLLLSLFIMAFLPAVCEEILFRGGLQNFLVRATGKPWLSII
ncbi:MAG TPA: CPBP family glutamic-type intramembrane protease, partial [Anseongella sp.]|nr:CPBP family glutamic-type intramembrane protease [Anseongella sp.]